MTPTTKRSIPIATNNPNPPVSSRLIKPIMINIMPRTTHTNVKVTMLPYLLAAISRTPTRACTGQVALWLDHKHLLHRQCLQPPTKPDQTAFPQRDPRLLPRSTRRVQKGGLLRRVFLSTPIASAYSFSHLLPFRFRSNRSESFRSNFQSPPATRPRTISNTPQAIAPQKIKYVPPGAKNI